MSLSGYLISHQSMDVAMNSLIKEISDFLKYKDDYLLAK